MSTFSIAQAGFLQKEVSLDQTIYKYQVHVPMNWTPAKKWPMVLFLHGAGERGSDGIDQTVVGLGPVVKRDMGDYPAVMIFPQCRRGVWWNDPKIEKMVMKILERSMDEYSGDNNRIYLTGLSMGGYGTFYFGSKYPDKFAALAPICGGVLLPNESRNYRSEPDSESPYLKIAKKIGKRPIWIFHGAADPVVPVDESRRMRDAFENLGIKVRYSEYPSVGHNSWDQAYGEEDFAKWMLSQRLR